MDIGIETEYRSIPGSTICMLIVTDCNLCDVLYLFDRHMLSIVPFIEDRGLGLYFRGMLYLYNTVC